ncbi:DUF6286 domain-containing protein [Pseudonocardia asaccharolytica]|uniref:Alkaline shock response membrane anchor protein AmaP n=1 Tax=Pseudonocardia asaccharolytica DSM 44247 = NBRC 16224 TaxID=1123024 RepID=A0A511D844_9PSEU|nr:DUF6286 domain-containing protein [Pseudonocardia asaccharolytica]GEL20583.1 hypothetical protein PA7_44200 [Pseudonocardia asaccharolytica DSM 44247 = NBRC 16224]
MRALVRVLAPLLGLGLAAVGAIAVIEVVAAWARPPAGPGLVVPWAGWRSVLAEVTWQHQLVAPVAIGVAVAGLLLALIGIMARRAAIRLAEPAPGVTVVTSPRVLARLVGRRVRAADDVAAASVTASGRTVTIRAEGWASGAGPGAPGDLTALRRDVRERVDQLFDELPLVHRPRVSVGARARRGPR